VLRNPHDHAVDHRCVHDDVGLEPVDDKLGSRNDV
jgi:hypothetical protein